MKRTRSLPSWSWLLVATLGVAATASSAELAVAGGSKATAAATSTSSPRMAVEALLQEFRQEAETTRRVLERVPEGKLGFKPHPKSRSLGNLAFHVATVASDLTGFLRQGGVEATTLSFAGTEPESKQAILSGLDTAISDISGLLESYDDRALMQTWTLTREGKPVLTLPRVAVLRGFMLNHSYHHRGQLTVYLRLLDEPVPSVYGPSADEKPPFLQ